MQLRNKAVLVISKVYYLYILRCTMLNYNICKISTGDFRIVPITWFSENNATFQWPPYGNINEVNTAICNMYEPESDWDEISLDKILTSKNDYSSAKDILQIIQVASDQELSELDETKLKKSRSKRHKKKYQSTDDASTSNDENDNGAKTRKKVKKASHDKLPLKPANFQSLLKCTKTTNKSPDATKTRINVEKETVADDSQFSRSSSLTLLANYDNNDNQSSSTVHEKSLLKPVVDLTSISKIEPILSSLVEFSKDIIGKINKLTSSIEDFNKRIQIVENILNTGRDKLINENSITDEIEDFIPLQTVDKFNEFDNKLNDQKYIRQVV